MTTNATNNMITRTKPDSCPAAAWKKYYVNNPCRDWSESDLLKFINGPQKPKKRAREQLRFARQYLWGAPERRADMGTPVGTTMFTHYTSTVVPTMFTHEQMSAAFAMVRNPLGWKYSIDKVVADPGKQNLMCLREAIAYFTGSHAVFTFSANEKFVRVQADGYYVAVGR
jgi:hypothetical protein